jgi:hypothetical protein
MKHETPDWLDVVCERLEISREEYYESFGLNREQFWQLYFQLEDDDIDPRGFFQAWSSDQQEEAPK